ncbi:cupin-like domain-containing protein [Altericista sp. CCNU0014]|uniref:cupin-like domain-containing protein n=1 Tax=Altericista sp. CCNU0014 TaxID=3082949 RepID=UPI00384B68A3
MVLNNVERIPVPSSETFFRDCILPQQPVIITNLFDEAPLRSQTTLPQVKKSLSDATIEVRPNYIAQLLSPTPGLGDRQIGIGGFLDELEANPETMDACSEYPTPPELLAQLPLKRYRHLQDERDLYSNLFVAGSKNYAHLHYDADQREVLLYQCFGVKRVAIIHPQQTQKLDPIHRADLRRTSSFFLENMSEAEKAAFLTYAQAWDTLLHPGETIYMPAMCWHYIEYLEPAMSIGYRLGRNPYNQRLAALFPAPSVDVQALAIALIHTERARENHTEWLERLETAARTSTGTLAEQSSALERLCLQTRQRYLGIEPTYSIREWGRQRALGL